MTTLDKVMRGACLAATLIVLLTVNASAETLILVCQSQSGSQPYQVRIDLEKKAITYYARADLVGKANITDATITARLPSNPINPSEYEDIAIDRNGRSILPSLQPQSVQWHVLCRLPQGNRYSEITRLVR
jgi:hypothetical protein